METEKVASRRLRGTTLVVLLLALGVVQAVDFAIGSRWYFRLAFGVILGALFVLLWSNRSPRD